MCANVLLMKRLVMALLVSAAAFANAENNHTYLEWDTDPGYVQVIQIKTSLDGPWQDYQTVYVPGTHAKVEIPINLSKAFFRIKIPFGS